MRCCEYKVSRKICDIVPAGMCPAMFYASVPYIYVLLSGGWFSWTKKANNTFERKSPDSSDLSKRGINRAYPNEVLVRCPEDNVVVGIGPWGDNIKIRKIFSNIPCNMCDEVIYKGNRGSLLEFNSLYPNKIDSNVYIKTLDVIRPCRYHKKNNVPTGLLPGSLPADVFQKVYPDVLSVMYGGSYNRKTVINGKMVDIDKEYLVKSGWKYMFRVIVCILRLVFEKVFYPVDILDYEIIVTIDGRKFKVNMDSQEYLCPAAFHSIYPYLGYKNIVPCPDCVGTSFDISKGVK